MYLQITGIKLQVAISMCLYLGPIISGYGGSWSGPVIPKLRDLEQSPFPYLLTETQLALVGSFAYLGAIPGYAYRLPLLFRKKSLGPSPGCKRYFVKIGTAFELNVGPYITTWLSNSKGRKPCLIAGAVVSVLGYLFLALSTNLTMLYIGRFLTSVSFGTNSIVNFVYIGEIASPNIRGVLLSIIGAMFTVGSILVFSSGPYVSYYETSYIGGALCIIHVICLLWIPESPIFHAIQGNDKELIKVLDDLGRSQDAERLLNMGKEITNTDTKKEWKELFNVKSNRKALFIAVVINVLQHSSGVMAVIFFSAAIFNMAGSSLKSHLAMIIIGCCQLLGSTITPFFIESTGRKRILITSSAICSLSMFILGLYFYLALIGNPVVDNAKWLPLVVLILFYIGYDFGLGIIPNAIMGEMFTPNVRSKGSTVTMTSSWLFGFLISTAFGALLEVVGGHVAFWFFSFTCACAAIFTIFFVPETKGKSLMEIQEGL